MSYSIPGLEDAHTGLDQNMLQKNKFKQTQSQVDDITNSEVLMSDLTSSVITPLTKDPKQSQSGVNDLKKLCLVVLDKF